MIRNGETYAIGANADVMEPTKASANHFAPLSGGRMSLKKGE